MAHCRFDPLDRERPCIINYSSFFGSPLRGGQARAPNSREVCVRRHDYALQVGFQMSYKRGIVGRND
jgi:hypothetical protein